MKSLYLLHGIYGSEYDWIVKSRIAELAMERNLAVFMPAGENKFYSDLSSTHDNFAQYIGADLVDFTRTMFRLSEKREDTFIGGLSMGGVGSLLTGLRYPETFGYIGAFSSALVLEHYPINDEKVGLKSCRSLMETLFGEEENFSGGSADYYAIANGLAEEAEQLPHIYMACGLQDSLLESNRQYSNYLISLGYDVKYGERQGAHEWGYWDYELENFLDWLPCEKQSGRNQEV